MRFLLAVLHALWLVHPQLHGSLESQSLSLDFLDVLLGKTLLPPHSDMTGQHFPRDPRATTSIAKFRSLQDHSINVALTLAWLTTAVTVYIELDLQVSSSAGGP